MDEGAAKKSRKKGLWTVEEDRILMDYIRVHGKGKWNHVAKMTGLKRCGKSCRLRWINYLSPNVKRDNFSQEEDDLIIRLHKLLGNRWSLIAGRVPGRTDNQVKNHWNTHLSKANGVGKGKCKVSKRNSTSFQPRFTDDSNIPSTSNDNSRDKDGVEGGAKTCARELTTIQGTATSSDHCHWDHTSFFFLDDYPNLYSPPNLFQVLHPDSLDFLV